MRKKVNEEKGYFIKELKKEIRNEEKKLLYKRITLGMRKKKLLYQRIKKINQERGKKSVTVKKDPVPKFLLKLHLPKSHYSSSSNNKHYINSEINNLGNSI